MSVRRCVFIDFDGTFAVQGVAPLAHGEAVVRARANGHAVLLSTGRCASIVAPEVAALFDGVVSSAGAHIRIGDTVLEDRRFPPALGRRAVEVLLAHGPAFALESPEALWCSPDSARRITARMASRPADVRPGYGNGYRDLVDAVRVPEDLAASSFAKISLWGSPVPVELLAAEIGDQVAALPNSISQDDTASGEIHLATVDKADGMRTAAAHLDIGPAATVAIGDGANDLGMLRSAGTAIAIAGSRPDVLAAADLEVPGPAEHGIVTAFERLGLL